MFQLEAFMFSPAAERKLGHKKLTRVVFLGAFRSFAESQSPMRNLFSVFVPGGFGWDVEFFVSSNLLGSAEHRNPTQAYHMHHEHDPNAPAIAAKCPCKFCTVQACRLKSEYRSSALEKAKHSRNIEQPEA